MAKRKIGKTTDESIVPLLATLQAVQNLILKFNSRGVIIGGVAASLLGVPRFTVDLDAVLLLNLENQFLDCPF